MTDRGIDTAAVVTSEAGRRGFEGLPGHTSGADHVARTADAVAGDTPRRRRRRKSRATLPDHGPCSHPGCKAPRSLARYTDEAGRPFCISHAPPGTPGRDRKTFAAHAGGDRTRRRTIRFLPEGTPDPDWSTPAAIRRWAQERAGRVERGELDGRALPHELAKLARACHETELLEKVEALESLIRARLTGAVLDAERLDGERPALTNGDRA